MVFARSWFHILTKMFFMNRLLISLLIATMSSAAAFAQAINWTSSCENRMVCLNPGSCSTGNAVLWEQAVTSSCGNTKITYIYRLDLDNNNTVDQTATADTFRMALPRGVHRISWRASDACGKAVSCSYTVTVDDCQPPSLICRGGSSTALSAPLCREVFTADRFILSVSDNCTPVNQIKKGIRRAGSGTGFPTADTLSFANCDVGVNIVEVWAQDQKGRVNQCNTYVLVQENSSVCPCVTDATVQVKGCVTTGNNKKLTQYRVQTTIKTEPNGLPAFNKTFQIPVTNDSCYTLPLTKVPLGGPFRLTTRMTRTDAGPLDGVSTADIYLISQHILNVRPFTNFYQGLAADVNLSNTITTLDIVEIRRLILGISDSFSVAPAWRFVRPVANPAIVSNLEMARDTYQTVVNEIRGDITVPSRHFIAVKTGDVNYSNKNLLDNEGVGDRMPVSLISENLSLKPGDTVAIPIRLAEPNNMDAWQIGLQLNPRVLELTGIEGVPPENYAFDEQGAVRAIWYEHPVYKTPETPLLTLRAKVLQPSMLQEALRAAPEYLAPECYRFDAHGQMEKSPFVLQFSTPPREKHQFFTPRPNPFSQETVFAAALRSPDLIRLEVLDLTGAVIAVQEVQGTAGLNKIVLSGNDLQNEGLYLYRLQAGATIQTGKLFFQRL